MKYLNSHASSILRLVKENGAVTPEGGKMCTRPSYNLNDVSSSKNVFPDVSLDAAASINSPVRYNRI